MTQLRKRLFIATAAIPLVLLTMVSARYAHKLRHASSALNRPGSSTTDPLSDHESFGARENPQRGPIGGGEDYPFVLEDGDWRVRTAEGLLDALRNAKPGQIVYVADDARIDLTGHQRIVIPQGVTLASGRGRPDSQGGLIFTTELGDYMPQDCSRPLFMTGGEGVHLSGLRIAGPEPRRRTQLIWDLYHRGGKPLFYSIPNADGIEARHPGLVVENCEMWGWSYAAVRLETGAHNAHIHHNYIHHCQRQGLGYGVCVNEVAAIIESNRFDWCRHAIAATGKPGTAYEAYDNIIDPNANSHSFDMHGGHDRKDGTDLAGDWVRIHHNTFKLTDHPAVGIRGRPATIAEIHHNRFAHETIEQAIRQKHAKGNVVVHRNMIRPAEQIVR